MIIVCNPGFTICNLAPAVLGSTSVCRFVGGISHPGGLHSPIGPNRFANSPKKNSAMHIACWKTLHARMHLDACDRWTVLGRTIKVSEKATARHPQAAVTCGIVQEAVRWPVREAGNDSNWPRVRVVNLSGPQHTPIHPRLRQVTLRSQDRNQFAPLAAS